MLERFDRVASDKTRSRRRLRRSIGLLVSVGFLGRTSAVLVEALLAESLLNVLEFVVGATPLHHSVTVRAIRLAELLRDLGDFRTGVFAADGSGNRGNLGNALFDVRAVGVPVSVMSPGKFSRWFLVIHRRHFTCTTNNYKYKRVDKARTLQYTV